MIAVLYALTRLTKPAYEARSWLCQALSRAFNAKSPSLHPTPGVPPNWKRVPCLSSSVNALAVITDENTLLHMSISMIPHHLFGSLKSPFFAIIIFTMRYRTFKKDISTSHIMSNHNHGGRRLGQHMWRGSSCMDTVMHLWFLNTVHCVPVDAWCCPRQKCAAVAVLVLPPHPPVPNVGCRLCPNADTVPLA